MTISIDPVVLTERAQDMSKLSLLFALSDIRHRIDDAEVVDQCYGSANVYDLLVERKAYRAELRNRRAVR